MRQIFLNLSQMLLLLLPNFSDSSVIVTISHLHWSCLAQLLNKDLISQATFLYSKTLFQCISWGHICQETFSCFLHRTMYILANTPILEIHGKLILGVHYYSGIRSLFSNQGSDESINLEKLLSFSCVREKGVMSLLETSLRFIPPLLNLPWSIYRVEIN